MVFAGIYSTPYKYFTFNSTKITIFVEACETFEDLCGAWSRSMFLTLPVKKNLLNYGFVIAFLDDVETVFIERKPSHQMSEGDRAMYCKKHVHTHTQKNAVTHQSGQK